MRNARQAWMIASVLLMLSVTATGQQLAPALACPPAGTYGQNDDAGHRANVNGISMYYETYGSGPPLLLIHGNGGSIGSMRCQIAHFSRAYQIIVADSRGHGRTDDGIGRLTYEQMADDLAALLTTMKVGAVDIIGQSDGGILALLLAIRHPAQVKALVASGPNLRPDATALFFWFMLSVENAVKEADAMLAKGDRSQSWGRVKRRNELMLDEPHIPVGDLQRIQAPALIIGGDEDVITFEHLLEIYRNIPKAQLFIVPGATHFALREEYALYNAAAERFLRGPFARPTTRQVIERR